MYVCVCVCVCFQLLLPRICREHHLVGVAGQKQASSRTMIRCRFSKLVGGWFFYRNYNERGKNQNRGVEERRSSNNNNVKHFKMVSLALKDSVGHHKATRKRKKKTCIDKPREKWRFLSPEVQRPSNRKQREFTRAPPAAIKAAILGPMYASTPRFISLYWSLLRSLKT